MGTPLSSQPSCEEIRQNGPRAQLIGLGIAPYATGRTKEWTRMVLAAEKGDITTIIGGIAPDWGPFGALGTETRR